MNNKLIILFFLLFGSNAWAQMPELSTQIDDSLCGVQAEICFEVKDFTDVAGFQFSISWDDTKAQNPEVTQKHSALGGGLLANTTDGGFAWEDTFNPITLADGEYIFCLKFDLTSPLDDVAFTFGDTPTARLVTTGFFPNEDERVLATNDGNLTCITLPIELSKFNVEQHYRSALQVNWETASEVNHDHFVLERMQKGGAFSPIATIEGKGTESTGSAYDFIDREPFLGDNYYRLKQVALSGEASYSKVVAANFSSINSNLQLYPNPTRERITLSYYSENRSGESMNVEIYNLQGVRVFKSQDATFEGKAFQKEYDLSFLPKGQYFLLMRTATAEIIERRKVVVF